MKKIFFTTILVIAALNTFAWHKAELYYSDGKVTAADIKLPSETISGIFNPELVVKNGDNENIVDVTNINKVILSNGITFVKFNNKGNPILLEQVTQYHNGINVLVLPAVYSPEFIETSHYMYQTDGNGTFEEHPADLNDNTNTYDSDPLAVYYSSITLNGTLYTPGANDQIYLMKGDQIERLQNVHTYGTLNKFMGDNVKISTYIKNGISGFSELNSLVAVYNAQASSGN